MNFRWFINLFAVFVPYALVAGVGLGWNVWANAEWNRGWAGGNFYLLAGTAYEAIQFFLSIGLIAEVPAWLRRMKAMRIFSVLAAAVQFVRYTGSLLDLAWLIWTDEDTAPTDVLGLLRAVWQAFDVIMHWPGYWMSLAIGIKEISLEFFQAWNEKHGSEKADVSIGMKDWGAAFDGGVSQFGLPNYRQVSGFVVKKFRK